MEYNIDYFYPEDLLYNLSKASGKAVMQIVSVGPQNCNDKERENEVWEFYYDKCNNDILLGLKKTGEIYCYFITDEIALECFNDWFPQKNTLTDDEMDFYFYVRVVNAATGFDIENG